MLSGHHSCYSLIRMSPQEIAIVYLHLQKPLHQEQGTRSSVLEVYRADDFLQKPAIPWPHTLQLLLMLTLLSNLPSVPVMRLPLVEVHSHVVVLFSEMLPAIVYRHFA